MTDVSSLDTQMNAMRSDLREMRISVNQIADAMTRLAILEERYQSTTVRTDRLEERLAIAEQKTNEVREAHIILTANIDGMSKAFKFLWAVLGVGVVGVVVKVVAMSFGAH